MQKLLIAIILSIFGFMQFGVSENCLIATNSSPQAQTIEENEFKLSTKHFGNNKNYLNVGEISVFDIMGDVVIYTNETQKLYIYNTKTNQFISDCPEISNVTNISACNNFVAVLSNGFIIILNNKFQQISTVEMKADLFSLYEKDNVIYVSSLLSNNLSTYKFNAINFDLIEQRPPYSLVSISNVVTIANDEANTYFIYKLNNNDKFTILNNNLLLEKEIAYQYKNTSHLILTNMSDHILFANVCLTNQNLTMFTIAPDNTIAEVLRTSINNSLTPTFLDGECASFSDIRFYNNFVYIADKENKTIQSFEYTNKNESENIFSFHEVLVASAGYEKGRFNNVQDILVSSDNEFYISDTNNNRLQIILDNEITTIDNYIFNGINRKFQNPKNILINDSKDLFVNNGNELLIYEAKTSKVSKINEVLKLDNTNDNLTNLSSICSDINGNIYAIESNLQSILKMDKDAGHFEELVKLNSATANSKLKFDIKNNYLTFYENEKITYFTTSGIELFTIQTEALIDYDIDFNGTLFALTSNSILKYELNIVDNNITLILTNSATYDFSTYSTLSISKELGIFYLFDYINNCIDQLSITPFSEGLINFNHPIDLKNNNLNQSIIKTGIVNNNCYIFNFPFNIGESFKMDLNSNVIVLDNTTYESFVYVIYNDNNVLNTGYISKLNINIVENQIQTNLQKLSVINKKVKIYKYPTILKDSSEQNIVLSEANLDEVLNNVCNINENIDNSTFYAVLMEDGTIGYVNSSDVTYKNNSNITPLVKTNAKIIGDENVIVYAAQSLESNQIAEVIPGTDIKVYDYSENNTFTKITYVNENLQEVTGYILTKYIKLDVNKNQTTAIVLICVSIVLLMAIATCFIVIKKKNSNN